MKQPVDGMKVRPYGDSLLVVPWFSLMSHAAGNEDFMRSFLASSPDISQLTEGRDVRANDVTCDREAFVRFLDYATEKLWGVE